MHPTTSSKVSDKLPTTDFATINNILVIPSLQNSFPLASLMSSPPTQWFFGSRIWYVNVSPSGRKYLVFLMILIPFALASEQLKGVQPRVKIVGFVYAPPAPEGWGSVAASIAVYSRLRLPFVTRDLPVLITSYTSTSNGAPPILDAVQSNTPLVNLHFSLVASISASRYVMVLTSAVPTASVATVPRHP